jgi:hypothetical protein
MNALLIDTDTISTELNQCAKQIHDSLAILNSISLNKSGKIHLGMTVL